MLLSRGKQKQLLKDFSDVKLQSVTDEIIDDDVEELLESMPTDVVHEVLLKATPENRNDKIVEIVDYLEEKKFSQLKPLLAELEPADLAEIFADLEEQDLPIVFRLLPKELAAETFVEMNSSQQELLIKSFSDAELKLMLSELFVDDTVDLIEEMPANVVRRILLNADSETRKEINEILKYPKDSAGSIMTTECISLRATMTVQQCFEKIRAEAIDKETIYTCYVTDEQKKLIGIVTVKDLLLHKFDEQIGTFMEDNYIYADTLTDKEEVANDLSKYDLLAVPIVDQENRLVGIVTVDDALDVITEEATEDISYLSSVTPFRQAVLRDEHGAHLSAPPAVAADPDDRRDVYGAHPQHLSGDAPPRHRGMRADGHGNGRQCGQSGVRHHHPRHGARSDTPAGYFKSHLEGAARGAFDRALRRTGLLRETAPDR